MGRYISCPRWGDFKLQVEIKLSINTLKETCYRFVAACINSINSRIDCFNNTLNWPLGFSTGIVTWHYYQQRLTGGGDRVVYEGIILVPKDKIRIHRHLSLKPGIYTRHMEYRHLHLASTSGYQQGRAMSNDLLAMTTGYWQPLSMATTSCKLDRDWLATTTAGMGYREWPYGCDSLTDSPVPYRVGCM